MPRPSKDIAAPAAQPEPTSSAPFTPSINVEPRRREDPPKVEAVSPFLLFHQPNAYTVIAGKVVPRLSKFKLTPGVNGVGFDERTKSLQTGDAIDELRRNGATVLPWDVDGPGTSYLLKHMVHPNLHHTRFEKFQAGSSAIRSDEAGYAAWLCDLMERDVLPKPRPDHLETLFADKNRELEEVAAEGKQKHRAEQLKAQVDAITAAMEAA
jgi:hypothetical protein